MVRFKFQIEGYDSDWLAGATGARGLRDAVEQLPTSNVPCQLSFQAANITGDQLKNFLALLAKCWRHIQFGATPSSNPWSGWRERAIEELDFARLLPPNMTFDVETSVWSVITSPCSVKSGAAVLLRLVNMLEWSVKFSDRIRLTTNTPFKFETFEEISKHCRPGMNFPERRPEPERTPENAPAAPANETAAML